MTAETDAVDWTVDFESVRREQLRGWMAATPEQKLQWLEDAQKLAYSVERNHRKGDQER